MTDEAEKAYEAMIEKMALAMYEEHARQRYASCMWLEHSERYRESVRSEARAAAEAIGLKPGCVVVDVAALNSLADNMAADLRRDWNAIQADGCDDLKMAINAMIAAAPTPQAD